ncbi:hypothetical protein [Candidatus Palauibacter sp.]|uniref:hypothetical protein n=1 Tax=Candidatus Palauibacter sp. TaxID=3101350 RepID=UPI003CC61B15
MLPLGALATLEGFRTMNRPFRTFADGDTSPDVTGWSWFKVSNTAATTIDGFAGAVEGQEIVLIATTANTTLEDASNGSTLKLAGGADRTLAADELVRFIHDGTNWYEA